MWEPVLIYESGSQDLDSGSQSCWQVLLPNEPTSGPLCDALTQGILLLCRSMF